MDQLTESKFDYNQLKPEIADFLKDKETNMRETVSDAYYQLGKELKEAQNRLSQNGYGCFREWCKSLGFSKSTVYNYINYHNLIVQQLDKRKTIESLPKGLAYEIAKKSADPELKQQVLDGDITSHKKFKELKKEKEELERRKNQLEARAERIGEMYEKEKREKEELERKEPEVIEKEVIPDDYKKTKQKYRNMKRELQKREDEIKNKESEIEKMQNKMKRLEESAELNKSQTEEYKELKKNIRQLKEDKSSIHRKIEAATSISGLIVKIENMLQKELAPVKYSRAINEQADDEIVIKNLSEIIERVEKWCGEMRELLPNKNYIEVKNYE